MKTKLLLAIITVTLSAISSARIGEDIAQLRERYGREIEATTVNGSNRLHFHHKLLKVETIIEDGKAVGIIISLRAGAPRVALDLAMAELLIKLNTPGLDMQVTEDTGPIVWEDPAHSMRAMYFNHPSEPKLLITILLPKASAAAD